LADRDAECDLVATPFIDFSVAIGGAAALVMGFSNEAEVVS
jgi:hypothetical protein